MLPTIEKQCRKERKENKFRNEREKLEKVYECSLCQVKFNTESALNVHLFGEKHMKNFESFMKSGGCQSGVDISQK